MPAKGQALNEKSKEKMKKAKQDKMASKFNWVIADPYLDQEIDNGSSNRQKAHMTLGEFKQAMLDGRSMKSLRDEGVSKHVLQFASNFCQGKINLTKSEFDQAYKDGMSLDEISEKWSVSRGDLTFLRQLYDIKRRGATYIHRKQNEIPLTQRQKEIIAGSLMGDAKRVSDSAVGFGHGPKQRDYLLWKYNEMQSVACVDSLKEWSTYSKLRDKTYTSWRFYTHANSDIEEIIEKFYGGGDKQIRQEVLDMLTPLSIAVWYMDDGSTDHMERKKRVNPNWNISSLYSFCTDSYDLKSCFLIRDWLLDRWGIASKVRQRGFSKENSRKFRIRIAGESSEAFRDLISPHIIPAMKGKL